MEFPVGKGKCLERATEIEMSVWSMEKSANCYLGSHAVKTITGLESTIDACRKMRLSTAKLQKIPSVILSVSVKGIKFIDARSKCYANYPADNPSETDNPSFNVDLKRPIMVVMTVTTGTMNADDNHDIDHDDDCFSYDIMVSYHDMKNISYITQDPEDRRVLAYIAKDAKTEKHYCHVFRVDSFALSDEVTMSIGQAFEIMVSYHDMKNISYITQDPEDRRVLAYIAKDAKTEKHYCHVFRVDSFALSDEVTMSIGQAFEV
ncbi:unnamed protein product, partial [Porites evermanni]